MTEKTLNLTDSKSTKIKVSDVEIFGDVDTFKLLCKASSKKEGWMKSTKAMQTPKGCVVQVSTQQKNPDGSYSLAEALTFVPGTKIRNIFGLLDKRILGRELIKKSRFEFIVNFSQYMAANIKTNLLDFKFYLIQKSKKIFHIPNKNYYKSYKN